MCKCTPSIRTPYCGKPGCERPQPPIMGAVQDTDVMIYPAEPLYAAAPDLARELNYALTGAMVLRAVLRRAGLKLGVEAADAIIEHSTAALKKAGVLP